jgi:hypothetical protein
MIWREACDFTNFELAMAKGVSTESSAFFFRKPPFSSTVAAF